MAWVEVKRFNINSLSSLRDLNNMLKSYKNKEKYRIRTLGVVEVIEHCVDEQCEDTKDNTEYELYLKLKDKYEVR